MSLVMGYLLVFLYLRKLNCFTGNVNMARFTLEKLVVTCGGRIFS
jgi:hypothetical protein